MEVQSAAIRAEFEVEEEELRKTIAQEKLRLQVLAKDREAMAATREADKTRAE